VRQTLRANLKLTLADHSGGKKGSQSKKARGKKKIKGNNDTDIISALSLGCSFFKVFVFLRVSVLTRPGRKREFAKVWW